MGFYLETYGGGRYTSIAWFPTKAAAEEALRKRLLSNYWSGLPPRIIEDSDDHNSDQ